MNETSGRSRLLMSRDETALLVVDAQVKLLDLIPDRPRLLWNIRRLLDGAEVLQVPRLATEQYPAKLGPTAPELTEKLGPIPGKLAFSCVGCAELVRTLEALTTTKVLVVGIETHVCVAQTALDLVASGYDVYVAVDAVAARREIDHATALRRLENSGVTPTTAEAALFEWCEVAGTAEFKQISQLIRQTEPAPLNSEAAS